MQNLVLDAPLYIRRQGEDSHRRTRREIRARPYLDASPRSADGLAPRLSLAVAVLHEPQMLILDEPTSGVDPVARDSFWELLIDLSRKQASHFRHHAFHERGDALRRISLMHAEKC